MDFEGEVAAVQRGPSGYGATDPPLNLIFLFFQECFRQFQPDAELAVLHIADPGACWQEGGFLLVAEIDGHYDLGRIEAMKLRVF